MNPTERRLGVLVMAHGTPRSEEELAAFYTSIRRGRPPSTEQLEELAGRYRAIGGTSPLNRITAKQVQGLALELDRRFPGAFVVRYGAKHTEPSIETAAAELRQLGVPIVGLVLTPHASARGSGEYLQRAHDAVAGKVPLTPVRSWYDTSRFIDLQSGRLRRGVEDAEGQGEGEVGVVFTAHSVPLSAGTTSDDYEGEVRRSAALVAGAAGVGPFHVAFQSAGRTPDPWLGPDLVEVLRVLAAGGSKAVVVCPIGFVADHLETLYDLDVEAKRVAESLGLSFFRTVPPNDDRAFSAVLADVVARAAGAPFADGGAAGR